MQGLFVSAFNTNRVSGNQRRVLLRFGAAGRGSARPGHVLVALVRQYSMDTVYLHTTCRDSWEGE